MKDISEMDNDTTAAIASIKSFDEYSKDADINEKIGTNREIKLHDKLRALEALSKHLGLFEKDNNQKEKAVVTIFQLPDNGRK